MAPATRVSRWRPLHSLIRSSRPLARISLLLTADPSINQRRIMNKAQVSPQVSPWPSLLQQIGDSITSLAVYVFVWYLVDVFLIGLDHARAPGDEWLQGVGRDLIAAFCAGYIGVTAALSWFGRSTAKFVFLGFTALILLLSGTYIGVGGEDLGLVEPCCGPIVTIGGMLWGTAALAVSVLGALCATRKDAKTRE